jgi:leader peptidase (prepilin peptidase) / N-methyltransferase
VVLGLSVAHALSGALAGLMGAALGSFAAVAIERIPRGQSLGGRSQCVCGTQIRARDNVPILSYLARRGRARCCGAPIPGWYLAAEVAGAAAGVAVYLAVI